MLIFILFFKAFYVASRLFLYYHEAAKPNSTFTGYTLFPLFYYLEEDREKEVKNEYEMPWMILVRFVNTVYLNYRKFKIQREERRKLAKKLANK